MRHAKLLVVVAVLAGVAGFSAGNPFRSSPEKVLDQIIVQLTQLNQLAAKMADQSMTVDAERPFEKGLANLSELVDRLQQMGRINDPQSVSDRVSEMVSLSQRLLHLTEKMQRDRIAVTIDLPQQLAISRLASGTFVR